MPTKVTGEDGRLLHDNLSDGDALDLARSVHANTGETLTLTPLVFDGSDYVADPANAKQFPAAVEESAEAVETSEPAEAVADAVAEEVEDPAPDIEQPPK